MDITQHALPMVVNLVVRNEQIELDERSMNALLRKIDLRLLPLLMLIFFFSFLGRTNIGNKGTRISALHTNNVLLLFSIGHARTFGLIDHLNVTKSQYKWTVVIFDIAYVSNESECGTPLLEMNGRDVT